MSQQDRDRQGNQLRILCLHGSEQNAEVLRTRLGSIPRKAKNYATFTIVDGTHVLPLREGDEVAYRSWYKRDADGKLIADTMQATIDYLDKLWEDNKIPGTSQSFDGIFGFSMGGTVAAYMASCYPAKYSSLKFVFVAGAPDRLPPASAGSFNISSSTQSTSTTTISPDIHSMHVMGRADNVVSMELMRSLAGRFAHPAVVLEHDMGHCIPSKAAFVDQYVAFFAEMYRKFVSPQNNETDAAAAAPSAKKGSTKAPSAASSPMPARKGKGKPEKPVGDGGSSSRSNGRTCVTPTPAPATPVLPPVQLPTLERQCDEIDALLAIYPEGAVSVLNHCREAEQLERSAALLQGSVQFESGEGGPSGSSNDTLRVKVTLALEGAPAAWVDNISVLVTLRRNYLAGDVVGDTAAAGAVDPVQCDLQLGKSLSMLDFTVNQQASLLKSLRAALPPPSVSADEESLYGCIQAGFEWIATPSLWKAATAASSSAASTGSSSHDAASRGTAVSTPGQRHSVSSCETSEVEDGAVGEDGDSAEETLQCIDRATRLAHTAAGVERSTAGGLGGNGIDDGAAPSSSAIAGGAASGGGGGVWQFTVGLVGKPSAGKSTFYNAVTKAALRSQDGRHVAAVSPHPFTTIEPNVGPGWFLGPRDDDLREDNIEVTRRSASASAGSASMDTESSGAGASNHRKSLLQAPFDYSLQPAVRTTRAAAYGRDPLTNRRLLPVTIKDVAGLVPGAYQGRGKGNRFLNDLCEADSLIHIVDASGSASADGNIITGGTEEEEANGDVGSSSGASSSSRERSLPHEDVEWVRVEIHRWIYNNISAKWGSISRLQLHPTAQKMHDAASARAGVKARAAAATALPPPSAAVQTQQLERLYAIMSGYQGLNHRRLVDKALARMRKYGTNRNAAGGDSVPLVEAQSAAIPPLGHWSNWERHVFVAHYLSLRFPTVIALNKIDRIVMGNAASVTNDADCTGIGATQRHEAYVEYLLKLTHDARKRGEVAIPVSAQAEDWAVRKKQLQLLGGQGSKNNFTPKQQQNEAILEAMTGSELLSDVSVEGALAAISMDASSHHARGREREREPAGSALWGGRTTGVMNTITAAVLMHSPLFVYPVQDLLTEAPIGWHGHGHTLEAASGGVSASIPRLRDCLLCSPIGTTSVHTIFSDLKQLPLPASSFASENGCQEKEQEQGPEQAVIGGGRGDDPAAAESVGPTSASSASSKSSTAIPFLHGEYVRAEGRSLYAPLSSSSAAVSSAASPPGAVSGSSATPRRFQCGRDTLISPHIEVLRIQTNRKVAWQHTVAQRQTK